MHVPVTVGEAMAGGTITVPTIDGPVKVPKTDDKEILEAAEKMNRFYQGDLRKDIRL